MLDRFKEMGGTLNGHPTDRLPHNLNVRFPGIEGKAVINSVSDRVAISAGSACTTQTVEPSHVLLALGLSEEQAHQSIRFGLGRFTTGGRGGVCSPGRPGGSRRHIKILRIEAPVQKDCRTRSSPGRDCSPGFGWRIRALRLRHCPASAPVAGRFVSLLQIRAFCTMPRLFSIIQTGNQSAQFPTILYYT